MARRCLQTGDTELRAALVKFWRQNLQLLKNESPEGWQEPYFVTLRQARALGVEVCVTGQLPETPSLREITDTAITAHVTNIVRHAHGKTAYISVEEQPFCRVLRFTNDGTPPKEGARETGGLKNLRRRVEAAGGEMILQWQPAFTMTLKLPKKENGYGISRTDR